MQTGRWGRYLCEPDANVSVSTIGSVLLKPGLPLNQNVPRRSNGLYHFRIQVRDITFECSLPNAFLANRKLEHPGSSPAFCLLGWFSIFRVLHIGGQSQTQSTTHRLKWRSLIYQCRILAPHSAHVKTWPLQPRVKVVFPVIFSRLRNSKCSFSITARKTRSWWASSILGQACPALLESERLKFCLELKRHIGCLREVIRKYSLA